MTGWHNQLFYGIPTSLNFWKKWSSRKCMVSFFIF